MRRRGRCLRCICRFSLGVRPFGAYVPRDGSPGSKKKWHLTWMPLGPIDAPPPPPPPLNESRHPNRPTLLCKRTRPSMSSPSGGRGTWAGFHQIFTGSVSLVLLRHVEACHLFFLSHSFPSSLVFGLDIFRLPLGSTGIPVLSTTHSTVLCWLAYSLPPPPSSSASHHCCRPRPFHLTKSTS